MRVVNLSFSKEYDHNENLLVDTTLSIPYIWKILNSTKKYICLPFVMISNDFSN